MTVHLMDSIVFGDSLGTAEMRQVFAETSTYQRWLDVEVALAKAQASLGMIPPEAAQTIASKANAALIDLEAVKASGKRTGHSLLGASTLSVTEHNALCRGNDDRGMVDNTDTLMLTDSEELMKRGVEVAAETWTKTKQELDWTDYSPDCVCTHQVGVAHKRLLLGTLGIDPAKDFETLSFMGNVGSVSCPATMAMAAENGRLRKGNMLALLGIGSGINCTMMGVEW